MIIPRDIYETAVCSLDLDTFICFLFELDT